MITILLLVDNRIIIQMCNILSVMLGLFGTLHGLNTTIKFSADSLHMSYHRNLPRRMTLLQFSNIGTLITHEENTHV